MIKFLTNLFGFGEKAADSIGNADERLNARLRYRIEAAMQYVFVDEKVGEYADFNEAKRQKYKRHFRKRIFDAS